MTTSTQTLDSTPPRRSGGVRHTAAGRLAQGVGAVLARIAPRSLRRRVAATTAAAALAATSLLAAQPAAASGVIDHTMVVRFDYAQFTQVSDGCCPDNTLELYGSIGARTSAGQANDGYWTYRTFGTWAADPCEVTWSYLWNDSYGGCSRKTQVGVWAFSDLHYCQASGLGPCVFPYSNHYDQDNYVLLTVRSGETITFDVKLRDYDALSADDDACVGSLTVGPFTDTQLYSFWFSNPLSATIKQAWNGSGACSAHVTMYRY